MKLAFFDNLLRTLGWTFIHSLWIGVFLTIAAAIIILGTKHSSPNVRYRLLCSTFLLFLLSMLTAFILEWNNYGLNAAFLGAGKLSSQDQLHFIPQVHQWVDNILSNYGGWIISAWLFIFLGRAIRMTNELQQIRLLRNSATSIPDNDWQLRFERLRERLNITAPVRLLESALVKVPIVIGHLKPLVLVPAGIFCQLPPNEIEAVLLHELAHIRRNDYLVNLIQRITEMIFFFNPGLLWISALLRSEREHCCDDVAINSTNNREQYVNALIRFREQAMQSTTHVLAFPGQRNGLLHRISRIVYRKNRNLSGPEGAFALMSMLVCIALLTVCLKKPIGSNDQAFAAVSTVNDPFAPTLYFSSIEDSVQPETEVARVSNSLALHVPEKAATMATSNRSFSISNSKPRERKIFIASHAEPSTVNLQVSTSNKNRTDAEEQRAIAEAQRQNAVELRKQADLSRADADKQRLIANMQREEADKMRLQADKNRQQADLNRAQAEIARKEADQFRKQAELDRQQAEKRRADIVAKATGT